MIYETKNFTHLAGIEGFSDDLLKNHFGLYEGYVKNVGKLSESLEKFNRENKLDTPEYTELKRRFGWEWNGMRLHEYYFSNLAKEPKNFDGNSTLALQIKKDFGTFSDWEKDFRATAAMRGIGWAIMHLDPAAQKLLNVWVNEHDTGHLAGAVPVLVLDVFEHAYMLDYGTKKADYIEVAMKVIDWETAARRYDLAMKALENKPKDVDHFGCLC
jgi:Fe-Mn family superoxide dismutase